MCPYTTCGQMVIQLWGQQQVIWQFALIQVVLYLYKTEIVQAKHNLAILKVQVMGCLAIQEVPVRFDWRPHNQPLREMQLDHPPHPILCPYQSNPAAIKVQRLEN
jgi:hypothetical protein